MVDTRAIGAGQADRQHPAHRMTDQVEAIDMKTVEQGDRGARHGVETIGETGLGRLAEADLIRGDDPIARLGQRLDGRRPIAGGKVASVQKHDCPPCRRAGGGHIHICEAQILAFEGERQEIDRIGVRESLERDAHRLGARRRAPRTRRSTGPLRSQNRRQRRGEASSAIRLGRLRRDHARNLDGHQTIL